MGDARKGCFRVQFNRRIKLEFHGAKVVHHARYITFQMAEVAIPREMFRTMLKRVERLRLAPDTG